MLLLIVLWTGWCVLHSLLITTSVRRWVEAKSGAWLGLYRLVYVGFSVATLLPLLWYTQTVPQHPLASPPWWVYGIQAGLLIYALVLFVGGIRAYDLPTFLGTRQWRDYRSGRSAPPQTFQQTGILRFVRHPWYSGGIALLWAVPGLTNATLITRTILSCYLIFGALLEERKLLAMLGEPYRAYCRQVPMLFPWKFWL